MRALEPAETQIRRVSTVDQVADALRERILRGDVAPGSPLRETALAQGLGVSRNTIREAIRTLAHEGIVAQHLHRGAAVVELTAEDVADIFRVREVVELAALRRGATPAHLVELSASLDGLVDAARSGEWGRLVEADAEFHGRVAALLGSRRLGELYRTIQVELRLCLSILSVVDREFERPELVVSEHRAIFEALAEGKRARAAELMRLHLHSNGERLRQIVAVRSS